MMAGVSWLSPTEDCARSRDQHEMPSDDFFIHKLHSALPNSALMFAKVS